MWAVLLAGPRASGIVRAQVDVLVVPQILYCKQVLYATDTCTP